MTIKTNENLKLECCTQVQPYSLTEEKVKKYMTVVRGEDHQIHMVQLCFG